MAAKKDNQPKSNSAKKSTAKSKQLKAQDLQKQIDKLTEDLSRERADFMNYKRRSELDRSMLMNIAKAEVVKELLPILDDLQRALDSTPEDIADNSWVKGLAQVNKQIEAKMSELDISKIEALGREFDPNLHEAIGFEDGDGEDEVVIEELRSGYKLGSEVLRPSMVKVGKSNSSEVKEDK